jgi:hypothetical protein
MRPRLVHLRREYQPAGPLYVWRRFKFRGVVYERESVLPADISPVRHRRLWQSGLAGHTKQPPLAGNKKTAPKAFDVSDVPAVQPQAEPRPTAKRPNAKR